MKYIIITLKSGAVIKGSYEDDDEYEELYGAWDDCRGRLCFHNCEIKASEIAAFQWED